jgi:predicted DNA-binding protein YlxM (UPF0122 family)
MYKSLAETAQALSVSRQSVHQSIKRGLIRAERIGQQWVVSDAEIARLQTPAEVARREKFKGGKPMAK